MDVLLTVTHAVKRPVIDDLKKIILSLTGLMDKLLTVTHAVKRAAMDDLKKK